LDVIAYVVRYMGRWRGRSRGAHGAMVYTVQ